MKVERLNQKPLTPQEQSDLEKLRKLVENVLADGRVSGGEMQSIRAFLHADHKVTVEELQMIRRTVQETLGASSLEEVPIDYTVM